MRSILFGIGLLLASLAVSADDEVKTFVVFNKPGVNWDQRNSMKTHVEAHVAMYRGLEQAGQLVVGGRLGSTPAIGISIVCPGGDADALVSQLQADPAVAAAILTVEIYPFDVRMGRPPCAE